MKELLDRLEEQARAIERLKAELDAAHRMLVMQDEDKEKQAPGYGGDGRWWPNSAITTVEAKVDPHALMVQNATYVIRNSIDRLAKSIDPKWIHVSEDAFAPGIRLRLALLAPTEPTWALDTFLARMRR